MQLYNTPPLQGPVICLVLLWVLPRVTCCRLRHSQVRERLVVEFLGGRLTVFGFSAIFAASPVGGRFKCRAPAKLHDLDSVQPPAQQGLPHEHVADWFFGIAYRFPAVSLRHAQQPSRWFFYPLISPDGELRKCTWRLIACDIHCISIEAHPAYLSPWGSVDGIETDARFRIS